MTAHRVKYGSVPDGIFRMYCGKVLKETVTMFDVDEYDEKCSGCFFTEEQEMSIEEDDRRTEQVEWPKNTDLDKIQ